MNLTELKTGQALVITGAQSSGKSNLARKIAEDYGTFEEIDLARMKDHFALSSVLHGQPKTLIVDGFPNDAQTLAEIKSLIASHTFRVNRKFRIPKTIKTPIFIFCTEPKPVLLPIGGDARFCVVHLCAKKTK